MKVSLVAHASVLIETVDTVILTDPWFEGTAFNHSWALAPEPQIASDAFDRVEYLWLSHEHPDHFHIQTLRNLAETFRSRVTVLFETAL